MNIKLEELPVNTVIEAEDHSGKYMKTEKHKWTEILSTYPDADGDPLDERFGIKVMFSFKPYVEVNKSLEDYFGKYTILSLPMPVVNAAIWFSNKLTNVPSETIIEEAIKYELVEENVDEEV